MKSRFMFGALIAILLVAGTSSAAVDSASEFLDIIQQRVDRGEITADDALLLKFQYAFDRAKLPEDLQPTWKAPMKCGTPLVQEYMAQRDRLAGPIVEAIEGYLAPPAGDRISHYSPSGLFRLNYVTVGVDAVPAGDANENFVPDWVETMAQYFDDVIEYECNTLGFQLPPFQPDAAYMSITLEHLDGIYGFTQPLSYPAGMTRITIDNDFVGYAPNDDPEGEELGAAKVTVAHEFKHSTQYAGSFWSEDGWVEVDATWAEEIVYPQVNDYQNYMWNGSTCPVSDPDVPLDGGSTGTGSYDDAVWELYMSDKFGVQFVVDFWDYRKTHRSEPEMDSYEQMFVNYGSDLNAAWNEFTTWNFMTGVRDVEGIGYHDSAEYGAGSPQHTVLNYPTTDTGFVQHLAANFQRLRNINSPGQRVRVTFDGADAGRMVLGAVINESYTTHVGAMYMIPLDNNNDAVFDVPYDLAGVYSAGFIVGNPDKSGPLRSYSITVDLVDADVTDSGDLAPAFAFEGNYPNPFNPNTSIKFTVGGTARTVLDIYDVAGHKVRSLLDQTLDAGLHTIAWNGSDDAGRSLSSGTYLAKLSSGADVTTHKLVLAK